MRNDGGNGNFLGVRRLPSRDQAQGVWNVQEAYSASRDGFWPAWPIDFGVPSVPAPLVWLEADYGLYSDVDATVPATENGAEVRSWVNLGTAGLIRCEPARNPLILRPNNGSPYIELNSARAQLTGPIIIRSNNYVFAKADTFDTSNTILFQAENINAFAVRTGANQVRFPTSDTESMDVSTSAAFLKAGMIDFAFMSQNPLFGTNRRGTAWLQPTGGLANLTGGSKSGPTAGMSITTLFRAFGSSSIPSNLKVKAMLWFSSDTPLTETQVDAIGAYLGGKWGFTKTSGSFG